MRNPTIYSEIDFYNHISKKTYFIKICKTINLEKSIDELYSIFRAVAPEYLFSKKIKDENETRNAVYKSIFNHEIFEFSYSQMLCILLAHYVDWLNNNYYQYIEIYPHTERKTDDFGILTPYNWIGANVIEKLQYQFENSLSQKENSSNDTDKILGQIIFCAMRESRLHNISTLKRFLIHPFPPEKETLTGPLKMNILLGKNQNSGKNWEINISPLLEMLIRKYFFEKFHRFPERCTPIYQLFDIQKVSNRRILKFLKKAFTLPTQKNGRAINLNNILDWVNFLDFRTNLPALYANIIRSPHLTYSLTEEPENNLNRDSTNKNFIEVASLPEQNKSQLNKKLEQFAKDYNTNNNLKCRGLYHRAIKYIKKESSKYLHLNNILSFEYLLSEYVVHHINDKKNKKKYPSNLRKIARETKSLLLLQPYFSQHLNYQFLGMKGIEARDFYQCYTLALDHLPSSITNTLISFIKKFHHFCVRFFDCQPIDNTFFTDLKEEVENRIRTIYLSPVDYEKIKKKLLLDNRFIKNNKQRQMLLLLLILGYRLGIRRWEVLNLTTNDFHLNGHKIFIKRHNQHPKTSSAIRKIDIRLLTNDEQKVFEDWLKFRHKENQNIEIQKINYWLFSRSEIDERPVTFYSSIDKLVKFIRYVTGIKTFTFHWLRHSAANNLLLSLETSTCGTYNLLKKLMPETNSKEFNESYQLQCAEVLLGRSVTEKTIDTWTGIYSISTILGHLSPATSFLFYIHTAHIIIQFYDYFTTQIHDSMIYPTIEYLLGIGRKTRNQKFPNAKENYPLTEILNYSRKKYCFS